MVLVLRERVQTKHKYFQPKWSPNGKWVAFYRQEHGKISVAERSSEVTLIYILFLRQAARMRFLAQSDSDHTAD